MAWLLLNTDMGTVNWVEIGLTYAVMGLIIIVSLVSLAIMKKKMRKDASLGKVKAKCVKAMAYAEKALSHSTKRDLLIASTKMHKLVGLVSDAEWVVTCMVEDKKDLILEDLAGRLDRLANAISTKAEETFFSEKEYVVSMETARDELQAIIVLVDELQAKQKGE